MVRGRTILLLLLAARVGHAAPSVLVRVGDPSPFGLPFSRFSDPSLDDRGHVAFVGASTALFTRAGDALAHLAGAGDLLLGHRLAGVGPAVSSATCLAFRSAFVGGGAGVFRQCGGTSTLVVETGLPAPGGGRFAGVGEEVALGSAGQVVFTAVLEDGRVGLFFVGADGTLREITRSGTVSPAGGSFTSFRLVGIASTGRVAFRAVTSNGPDGLFYWDGTGIRKLVVVGDASAGGNFTSIGLGRMNDGETWTFRAVTAPDSRAGVFRASTASTPPTVAAVAAEGDPTPVGGTFGAFPVSLVPAINASGTIAFRATVRDASLSSGVFVATADGSLTKAVAVGETTKAGRLVRLREVAIADDGSVVVRAALVGGMPGLFQARAGQVDRLVVLGDTTDLGGGFRFSDPVTRATTESALFLGTREGLFVALAPGVVSPVATLGDPTPLRGTYAGFDPPAAGGRLTVFGASIQGGRSGEALLKMSAGSQRDPVALVHSGDSVRGVGRVTDLFANPLDDLARAGVGGAVAFQAVVGGKTGILVWSGGRVRAVARSGKKAPGKGTYLEFGSPGIARSGGGVAFVAQVQERGQELIHVHGGRPELLAARGTETGTRLGGRFRTFDTPAVAGPAVAFRATLNQPPEAVFVATARCMMALAASGEREPGGGRFKSFGPPAFAGSTLVFRASVLGGATPVGLFRTTPSLRCTADPPAIEALAVAGAPSPAGAPFLGFGTPAGNHRGEVVFTADLTGGGASDAIILERPETASRVGD